MYNVRHNILPVLVVFCLTVLSRASAEGEFRAYSMAEAERRLKEPRSEPSGVQDLGGITRIAGLVYDQTNGDLIVVGQVYAAEPRINLDDLVVGLRSRLVRKEWPLVSIDKLPDSEKTERQAVRFAGGIDQSQLGLDVLQADIILKKLALGYLPGDIWGVRSYFDMSVERARNATGERGVSTRFWFRPVQHAVAAREGVVAVRELTVGIRAEVLAASTVTDPAVDPATVRDEVGEAFAAAVSASYEDLVAYYPELARVSTVLRLVALAYGLESMPARPDLDYWLHDYTVEHVDTPTDYPLLRREQQIPVGADTYVLEVDGGIELSAFVERLEVEGDIVAIRDAVIGARPPGNSLTWSVPLDGWHIPGYPDTALENRSTQLDDPKAPSKEKRAGCSLTRRLYPADTPAGFNGPTLSFPPPPGSIPQPEFAPGLVPRRYSDNIGGVMLRGAATPTIKGELKVELGRGSFALVVDGHDARLDRKAFRKFLTALWSVYYCKQDPGISIDPIAPGVDKHLVRYIGNVINSDLARVMREADYLMKKLAVGTERPSLPGFKDVDALSASHGLNYVGASRRFWFVPEDMRFRASDGILLFDSGRMTLKTEYVLQDKVGKAEPADEAFAGFFTGHYQEIARQHAVYEELLEYAKLVSLAKYLKENGVPMFWFLMANKDQVLTEDSPGTVDALAKGSEYFKGLSIEGGVDLACRGTYVRDERATRAIEEAFAKLPTAVARQPGGATGKPASMTGIQPLSFDCAAHTYTVLPQHSLTTGTDRRGVRYQTDLASRDKGEPGLELVRYYDPSRTDPGEFGDGWHLLIPYRLQPADAAKREFLNAVIPTRMALLNQLTGEQEVLTFSTERYSIAGYVPETLEGSQVVGLFVMSDASCRLADKLGNEFWFDPAGYLTDMVLGPEYRLRIEYEDGFTGAVDRPPYHVESADTERIGFLNARIPARMTVIEESNGYSETLSFSGDGALAGYVPEDESQSRFVILALTSTGAFQLLDKHGNEFAFDPAGDFRGLAPGQSPRMIRSLSTSEQKVVFGYAIGPAGALRIARAELSTGGEVPTASLHYEYDRDGRLCRVVPLKAYASSEKSSSGVGGGSAGL